MLHTVEKDEASALVNCECVVTCGLDASVSVWDCPEHGSPPDEPPIPYKLQDRWACNVYVERKGYEQAQLVPTDLRVLVVCSEGPSQAELLVRNFLLSQGVKLFSVASVVASGQWDPNVCAVRGAKDWTVTVYDERKAPGA